MRTEIKKLHHKVRSTIVYVTHDQVEAMTLADRIVIMRDGHIEQVGTPLEVFERPVNTFVATFIGSPPMNLLPARIEGGRIAIEAGPRLPLPGQFRGRAEEGQRVQLGFRADNLMPRGHALPMEGEHAEFDLTVDLSEPLGTETLLFSILAGREVQAKMFNPRPVAPGETLPFLLDLTRCHLFDAASGQSLR